MIAVLGRVGVLMLLVQTLHAANPNLCLLSAMDDPAEWAGPFAPSVVADEEGRCALMFDFGSGGSGEWTSETFAERNVDLDHYDLIKFDYRIENGGGGFSVRFRQWPFMGGFLAMGHHIDAVFRPATWRTMTFNLHEPENAWGQSYDRHDRHMDLSFGSVQADPGKSVRVFVDNIRLIRRQFSVDGDIDDLYLDLGTREDLDDGASRYRYVLPLQNRTEETLTVRLNLDTSALKQFTAQAAETVWHLPPKGSVAATVDVTVPASAKTDGPIAYSEETFARFAVEGDPESEHMVTLLAAVPFKTKPHPYLYATGEQIREARKRVERWGWAKAASDEFLRRADFAMSIPPGLPKYETRPEQPGDKVCSACGTNGVARPLVVDNPYRNACEYRYQCETCGKMLSPKLWLGEGGGFLYREMGYWWKPGTDESGKGHAISFGRDGNILDLAIAWQLTGKPEYLQRVADTIREYTEVLPTYPFSNQGSVAYACFDRKGGVRVGGYFSQTGWLHRMASTLDLIWDSGALSDQEKDAFLEQLTEIAYQRLRIWSPGYSNHRTTATGLGIALLTDNAPLLAYVLNDPYSGVHAFFRDTLFDDGFLDMAGQYMDPVVGSWLPVFKTLRSAGVDLAAQYPGLRRMGVSIQQWLDPDGLSPDIGDASSATSLAHQDWFEAFYAWTGDPRIIVPVQHRFYEYWNANRHLSKWEDIGRSRDTLFDGVDNIPRGNPEPMTGSYNFPDYGLLVFNQGEGDKRLWLAMPHGKRIGHGHCDNLHIEWWALGQKMTIKQGSRARHHAVHENTLLVDQQDQNKLPSRVSGFVDSGPVQGAVMTSDIMYPGTTVTRVVMLYDGLVFLLDLFDSDDEHLYDSVYLNAGTAHCDLPFKRLDQPLAEERNRDGVFTGYASLLDPEQADAPAMLTIDWDNLGVATNARVRQTQIALSDPGVLLRVQGPLVKQHRQWETMTGDIEAAGYTLLPEDRQFLSPKTYVEFLAPKFIRRFRARQAGLLTILEPCSGVTPRLTAIERLPLTLDGRPTTQGIAVRFTDEDGIAHQAILCPGPGVKEAGGWTIRGAFTAGPDGPLLVESPVP